MSIEMPESSSNLRVPGVFSWKMLRQALRSAEEGVYCWEIETGKIYYTEQCLRMMGLPFHEIAPNIFTQPEHTIHEDDVKHFKLGVANYIERRHSIPMRVELRLRNLRSRGWKWIRVNGLVERDENQNPIRLVGVWIDITRRKMASRRAVEERDLFRTLINHLPDNIYFKNRESRFVIANDATAKKLDVPTPSDLIGRSDRHFFDNHMSQISRNEELQIMETGIAITSRIHEETWLHKPSSWSQISKFPWYDYNGTVKGIVGISSDVTRLVEAQQRAQKLARKNERQRRALEKEIDLAREIQQALQPKRIPSYSHQVNDSLTRSAHFHHIFRPSAGVAGDCFQVFPVGNSGVGMLICDVMGHGVRAALIASVLRGLMEQVAPLADTPALLLSTLNRQLCNIFRKANITMFSTACYVYLDLEKRRLTHSGAGHPSPIVIGADSKAYLMPIPRSAALGLQDNAHYRESEIQLEPTTKLMLYTDGLTEARNAAGDEMGAVNLLKYLNAHPPCNIKAMLNNSIDGMNEFSHNNAPEDDICMLGLEFSEVYSEVCKTDSQNGTETLSI